MSNTANNQQTSEEIDLGYLFRKIGDLFRKCVKLLFEVIAFLIKFKFIVIAILLIGFGYGYYKDKTALKAYQNEVLVIPNVESVDYLYDKVEALNAKVRLADTVFLKKILDTNYRYFRRVEVEPIVDIYNFVSKSRENIDIFRILFQDQDVSEYMEDLTNSKYYKYHRLNFTVVGKDNSEFVVQHLLQHINDNPHYKDYLALGRANTDLQIREYELMIARIDTILKAAGTIAQNDGSSIYINENAQLYNLVDEKQKLLNKKLRLEMQKNDEVAIVKEVSASYNIIGEEGLRIPNKIKTPLFWLFLFCMLFFVRYVYVKMKRIAEEKDK